MTRRSPLISPGSDLPVDRIKWHTLEPGAVARSLDVDVSSGLTGNEAHTRLIKHGPNLLNEIKGRSLGAILVHQFVNLIVILLIAAATVAFVMGETIEGLAVVAVIFLNALIGFVTEWRAEHALSALRQQAVPMAHVLRDGVEVEIAARDLVPGDVLLLAAGSRVPADGRIFEAVRLQIEEASLTGESQPVEKSTAPIIDADAALGDRFGMAFLGTTVTEGRGRVIVTETGALTEVGRIGTLVELAEPEPSPLERKLKRLGHSLILIVLVLCAVIVLAGWMRGNAFLPMLEVGISLAIAAVPEGLPAVATMTLALGMRRMARMRALVRCLPAVETLGSTTVICSDKTGTLTRNEMTVRVLQLGRRRIEVTGTGYQPDGKFLEDEREINAASDGHLALALRVGALCNDARIDRDGSSPRIIGDPTEAALRVVAEKAGMDLDALDDQYDRIGEMPFHSDTKRMATVHETQTGRIAFVKGAPGEIIKSSTRQIDGTKLTEVDRGHLRTANEELAGQALRVLALAIKEIPGEFDDSLFDHDLTFVGLVGMIDPLREEAKTAIATCRTAGIRTIMITGDQAATAAEIGRQLGLDLGLNGERLMTVHGRELVNLDEQGWKTVTEGTAVFARVSPEQKLRIVEGLQARGEIVAMTGDGVNDAPALKKADIGVAMGIKGTEVAKEAADMIITDDNFTTIVAAVEQGRIIFANLVRFIHYLFSCNFAEVLVVFIAILLDWPLPLAALQVLWLNVITDVFPALALALEPSSPDAMKRPPRDPREPLVNSRLLRHIGVQGVLLSLVTLIAFWVGMTWYGRDGAGLVRASTIAFMTLALAQVFHAFSTRSQVRSVIDHLFTNAWLWSAVGTCFALQLAAVYLPPLQRVLHTAPLSLIDWWLVVGSSFAPVLLIESAKQMANTVNRQSRNQGNVT